mgnify:CR=1 FL=1
MRFTVRPSRRRLDQVSLNLASMIDVTFLLLIYFMISMVIQPREDQLRPAIEAQRESAEGDASDFQPQVIDVMMRDGQPGYRLGSRWLVGRQSLAEALEPLPKTVGVFVNVHDGVPVGHAAAAIQLARDAGFRQVTYVSAR